MGDCQMPSRSCLAEVSCTTTQAESQARLNAQERTCPSASPQNTRTRRLRFRWSPATPARSEPGRGWTRSRQANATRLEGPAGQRPFSPSPLPEECGGQRFGSAHLGRRARAAGTACCPARICQNRARRSRSRRQRCRTARNALLPPSRQGRSAAVALGAVE